MEAEQWPMQCLCKIRRFLNYLLLNSQMIQVQCETCALLVLFPNLWWYRVQNVFATALQMLPLEAVYFTNMKNKT